MLQDQYQLGTVWARIGIGKPSQLKWKVLTMKLIISTSSILGSLDFFLVGLNCSRLFRPC